MYVGLGIFAQLAKHNVFMIWNKVFVGLGVY